MGTSSIGKVIALCLILNCSPSLQYKPTDKINLRPFGVYYEQGEWQCYLVSFQNRNLRFIFWTNMEGDVIRVDYQMGSIENHVYPWISKEYQKNNYDFNDLIDKVFIYYNKEENERIEF